MTTLLAKTRNLNSTILVTALTLLGACTAADRVPGDGIYDPYETQNRKVHAFNRNLDRALVRPVARGYSSTVPDELEATVDNFAENLGQPSNFVNSLLQADLRGMGLSTVRFVMNTTIGIGGLVDAASEFGIPEYDTDFGETLYVWGAGEGAYVELPFLGPSTTRRTVGLVVDAVTNPLDFALDPPEVYYGTAADVVSGIGTRGRFSDTIDAILYESADSYAQTRLIYLQTRRFELGADVADTAIDPYLDPYDDPYEALDVE